jgi:hypothetical protein
LTSTAIASSKTNGKPFSGTSRPESITAAKIAETLDENPEGRAKQVRIGGKAYQLLQKKAAEAGMAISEYLERLINNCEPPDDEPPPDDEETTELTPEKEAICDRAEAFVKKAKPAQARICYQKAITMPSKSYQCQRQIRPSVGLILIFKPS